MSGQQAVDPFPVLSRLKFIPDGRKLATSNISYGGYEADNRVWSLDVDEGSLDVSPSGDAVWFAFSTDSRQLALADHLGTIRLWDLDRRAEMERFSAHVGAVNGVQWLPDGRIISSGADGALRIWEVRPSGMGQLKGYPSSLRTLAFSRDSRWLAAAGIGLALARPQWGEQPEVSYRYGQDLLLTLDCSRAAAPPACESPR